MRVNYFIAFQLTGDFVGADDVCEKIAAFINENSNRIGEIIISLDSHHVYI